MRLIDADAFTEQIAAAVLKKGTGEAAELGTNIIRLVDAQPTAYNVEKVIEELEKEIENAKDDFVWNYAAGMERALEIVRDSGKE